MLGHLAGVPTATGVWVHVQPAASSNVVPDLSVKTQLGPSVQPTDSPRPVADVPGETRAWTQL